MRPRLKTTKQVLEFQVFSIMGAVIQFLYLENEEMEDYTSCRTFMMVDTQNVIYNVRSSSCHTVGQVVLAITEAVHC